MSTSQRIGILGGTFNPVHVGHLRLALEVAEQMGLHRVELMPCAVPPHKEDKGLLPFILRTELLREAVKDIPMLRVSTLEAELTPPSYTWNLVQAWQARHCAPPLFILGDEDFAGLHTWFRGFELPECTDFAVVSRSDTGTSLFMEGIKRLCPPPYPCPTPVPQAPQQLVAHLAPGRSCTFLSLPHLDISASGVRKQWMLGGNIRFLVPDAVLARMTEKKEIISRHWQDEDALTRRPSVSKTFQE